MALRLGDLEPATIATAVPRTDTHEVRGIAEPDGERDAQDRPLGVAQQRRGGAQPGRDHHPR